nr:SFT2 [Hymenolepis microstoma]
MSGSHWSLCCFAAIPDSSMFGKPTTTTDDTYAFPPVLKSFLNKDSSGKSISSDRVPLITDISQNEPSQQTTSTSIFSRPFIMFSAPSNTEPGSFRGLSRSHRFLYFGISAFCASLFFSLALIFIPLLATPSGLRKFVFMYILGNIALMFAFAFAYGPWSYIKGLVTKDRIASTLVYFSSLFLGIYGVFWWRSTLCALLAIGIQVGLGFWQLKQFIWGGSKLLSFMNKFSSLRPGGSGSTLPV